MAKRRFIVSVDQVLVIEFDDTEMPEGIVPNDEWRSQMYKIHSPLELAEFFGYNILVNGVDRLTRIDGFADRRDDELTVVSLDHSETHASEVTIE